jgi:hypothetical protein
MAVESASDAVVDASLTAILREIDRGLTYLSAFVVFQRDPAFASSHGRDPGIVALGSLGDAESMAAILAIRAVRALQSAATATDSDACARATAEFVLREGERECAAAAPDAAVRRVFAGLRAAMALLVEASSVRRPVDPATDPRARATALDDLARRARWVLRDQAAAFLPPAGRDEILARLEQ